MLQLYEWLAVGIKIPINGDRPESQEGLPLHRKQSEAVRDTASSAIKVKIKFRSF